MASSEIHTIISDPASAEKLVKMADALGKELSGKKLSTSQIRTLFGEVRQIQAQWSVAGQESKALRRLVLLKPKMAYRARRERGAVEDLVKVLDQALDVVIQERNPGIQAQKFQHFVQFFEAILAYHQAYGGK